jgi:hypothetical protein
MMKIKSVLLISIMACWSLCVAYAQDVSPVVDHSNDLKVVVAKPEANSDSVIAVPPAVGQRYDQKHFAVPDSADLTVWLGKELPLNGLQSKDVHPWHIVIAYDQYDGDGDNWNSGIFEEYWASPQEYKRIYKAGNFNQTDYADGHGLHRSGDQRWPNAAEIRVGAASADPFFEAASLPGFSVRHMERPFGRHSLQCYLIEQIPGRLSDPLQYCFDSGGSVLRYTRGEGWFQTVYNNIVTFQGRNLAREVDVTDGGKRFLELRVETLEMIPQVDEAVFAPPPDAVDLSVKRVSGVNVKILKMSVPQWPASLRGQHVSVMVEIVIGKDGHVTSAHAVSGPPEAYEACEDAALKSAFAPYLMLGEAVEVETKIQFGFQ